MTEILTESFCERCGTRYTFETARPRNSRLHRARTFTKGLRNYVLSDDSFSTAMADARGEEELAATVLQLDAFHKTFNFCLDCRQYTCGNCWNAEDGRCLSCAPRPDLERPELLEPSASSAIAERLAALATPPEPPHEAIGIAAWPEADLPPADTHAGIAEVAADEVAAVGADAAAALAAAAPEAVAEQAAPEHALESAAPAQATAAPVEPAEPEASHPALLGLRAGESLDEAIAAYEAAHAADISAEEAVQAPATSTPVAQPEAGAEDVAAIAGEARPTATVEPEVAEAAAAVAEAAAAAVAEAAAPAVVEPAVAEPEVAEPAVAEAAAPAAAEPEVAEPEAPVEVVQAPAAAPEPLIVQAPAAAPEPEAVAAEAQPAMPTVEPATAPAPVTPARPEPAPMAPGWLTVAPDDGAAPAWPKRAAWPTPPRVATPAGTLGGRPVVPSGDAAALWAASAREVLEDGPHMEAGAPSRLSPGPTAQPCVGCGLPLSANARFCRRCGARQG